MTALIAAIPDGLFLVDADGVIVVANDVAHRMFGYSENELLGQPIDLLLPDRFRAHHHQLRDRYVSAPRKRTMGSQQDLFGRRKDGSEFPIDISLSPFETDGKALAIAIARDITERQETTHQLAQLNKDLELRVIERTSELELAKRKAEEASRAKSDFLSRMSHELRTPLNAILGYGQLLDLQYKEPRIKEATGAIVRAGKHLLGMVNEVLDLAQLENGVFDLAVESVSLSGVVRQAISLVQPIADGAGVDIVVESKICKEMYVLADHQRFTQVMLHLLSNAIKYNRAGGQVVIRCHEKPDHIFRVEISDTGAGISEADQKLLFQPFQRLKEVDTEGTGLGLALSRKFVEMMGGSLGIAESSSSGSTFFIELNRATEIRSPEEGSAKPQLGNLPALSGTLLYIDDHFANLRLLEFAFADYKDLRVIPAIQGQIGIELAHKYQPNLILLDLQLPDMDGEEVLKRLMQDPTTRSIPIIVFSTSLPPTKAQELSDMGVAGYLGQPLDMNELFGILEHHLVPR